MATLFYIRKRGNIMKIKNLIPFVLSLTMLSGCGETSEKEEISQYRLPYMVTMLEGDMLDNEVSSSNQATFKEVYTKEGLSVEEQTETWNIYDGQVSDATGEMKITYPSNNTVISDTYEKNVKVMDYDGTKVFYYIVDYADGNKRSSWIDSAARLPIVESGDADNDGYSYLLSTSVDKQLSKQVSLYASNFIRSNLTDNASTMSTYPMGYESIKGKTSTYYINPFTYSYKEDGVDNEVTIEFKFVIENDLLVSFTSDYTIKYTQDEDEFSINDHLEYTLSYGDRGVAPSTLLNPEDYFLADISEIEAYYYDSETGDEVVVDADKIPSNTYVHFRAKTYSPSKAVDIELSPADENATSDEKVISLDGSTFHSEKYGNATIKVTSVTGIEKEFDITVLAPELKKISYNDVYSEIEKETISLGSDSTSMRYVYSNTTYDKGITLTLTPSDAEREDIIATVDNPELVTVTLNVESTTVSVKYEVKDAKAGDTFTVTFTSNKFPDVKTSVTYTCKEKIADDQVIDYLKAHTYSWTHIYTGYVGTLSFVDDTHAQIVYKNGDETVGTTEFTYSVSGTTMTIEVTSENPLWEFESTASVTLDLASISFSAPNYATHTFKLNIVK